MGGDRTVGREQEVNRKAGGSKLQPLVGYVPGYGANYEEGIENGGGGKKGGVIQFVSYNTRKGHNGGLESALHGMDQSNMDLGVLQETNLIGGIYMRALGGYCIISTNKPIWHQGGVAVFYR